MGELIDWNKRDSEIAREVGLSRQAIGKKRRKEGEYPRKPTYKHKRYLVDVYVVEFETDNKHPDLTKLTEDNLNRNRDYQYQLQGESVDIICRKLDKNFYKRCRETNETD